MSVFQKPPKSRNGEHALSESALNLTEAQRRIIGSSLRVVEERVLACHSLLAGPGYNRRLVAYHDGYTPGQAKDLLRMLESLLETIYVLADMAGVSPSRQSVHRHIAASLASAWEVLEDLRPRRLKAYGPVDTHAASVVEPLIEEATTRIRQILDYSASKRSTPPGRSA